MTEVRNCDSVVAPESTKRRCIGVSVFHGCVYPRLSRQESDRLIWTRLRLQSVSLFLRGNMGEAGQDAP